NVSLRVQATDSPDTHIVSGRGELHLSVLIETMRREGYEFMVSRPTVVTHVGENGETLEPYEMVTADVENSHTGTVIEALGKRFGRVVNMRETGGGRTRIEIVIPTRALIGYRSKFATDTRGTGVFSSVFHEYGPFAGEIPDRGNGALIAQEDCTTVTYAIWKLEDRGTFFVGAGVPVYAGQIIGMHTRNNDLIVNPGKTKKLTNIRAAGSDEKNFLKPYRNLSIEDAIEFINDDELVEVTPKSIRLRKIFLKEHDRKRAKNASMAGA
ncbi:MAG: translational GTPase TypA, partial [Saprospiraceae bacterium]|nr:translational GTPase TypA [Saprospiraceae bacterium]